MATSASEKPARIAYPRIPLGADTEGRPVAFLETRTLRPRATYDDTPVERLDAERSQVEYVILETLRALGYVK